MLERAGSAARILLLGTYHFSNPGLDMVKTQQADILTAQKQAEIEEVVKKLIAFSPTKIAVEATPDRTQAINSQLKDYCDNLLSQESAVSERNEVYQLGFRMAKLLGLRVLYPIDSRGDFPIDQAMEYAKIHQPELLLQVQQSIDEITKSMNDMHENLSVREILRAHNDPSLIATGHSFYLRLARIGAGDSYDGARVLSAWYDRNIRIFANLQHITAPDDRILIIIGSGHAPILRQFVIDNPDMDLADTLSYL